MKYRFGKDINAGDIIVIRDEYKATSGVALHAYDKEGPFASLTICVPEIPLENDEIIVNHDLIYDSEVLNAFLNYLCDLTDGILAVNYGYAHSYKARLKENWKDLCITYEEARKGL